MANRKIKPNRNYHKNDLSFTCSKKHNNYIREYLMTVYMKNTEKRKNLNNMKTTKWYNICYKK